MDDLNRLFDLFRQKGVEKEIECFEDLSLSKEGFFYFFESASFFLSLKETYLLSSKVKHFFGEIPSPLAFSLNPLPHLEAVISFSQKTHLYEMKEEELFSFLEKNSDLKKAFFQTLLKTFHTFCDQFSQVLKKEETFLSFTKEIEWIEKDTFFTFSETLYQELEREGLWMQVQEGSFSLFGQKELTFSPSTESCPLTGSLWFFAHEKGRIELISSKEILKKSPAKEHFFTIKKLMSHLLSIWEEEKETQEKTLLENRKENQEKHFEHSLEKLGEALSPEEIPLVIDKEPPLKRSLQLLSQFLDTSFVFPPDAFSNKQEETSLSIICKASHVYFRKIHLKDNWWKSSTFPLLAFSKTTNKSFVLLNSPSGKFWKIETSEKILVTKKNQKDISSYAYVFYPQLQTNIKSGKDLLKLFIQSEKRNISFVFFYSLLSIGISFFFPIATKLIFTRALPESDLSFLLFLSLGLAFSSLGFAWGYYFRSLVLTKLKGLAFHFLNSSFWIRLLNMPLSFFRKFSAGSLYSKISSLDQIEWVLSGNLLPTIISGVLSPLYFFIMLFFAPFLSLIASLGVFVSIGLSFYFSRKKLKILQKLLDLKEKIQGFVVQALQGTAKLRTSGAEKDVFAYWGSHFSDLKELDIEALKTENHALSFFAFFQIFFMFLIYSTLIGMDKMHSISLANFLAFNIAYGTFSISFYLLCHSFLKVSQILALWKRTEVLFLEEPENSSFKVPPKKLTGSISVDNLSFAYPDTSLILKNLFLEISPRKTVALVGKSGCGKSTFINLLLGLEKPSQGALYFDDKDLSVLDLRMVRSQIGTVLQGDTLMQGTLYENLTSDKNCSMEEILKAIHLAGFEKDFQNLPMKLNTQIPAGGTGFSGGQRQRILLARALLKNPSILIFDEATSALDNETQKEIMNTILKLNVTRILVAQRLTTVEYADEIFVLEKGAIQEKGTFKELMNKKGAFFHLANQNLYQA